MIRIELELRDERIIGFRVAGHSGMGKRGHDIVCAGVSAVTQTALLGLLKKVNAAVDYRVERGDMSVELKSAPDDMTEVVLQTMRLGLNEIAKQYPSAVKIEIKNP